MHRKRKGLTFPCCRGSNSTFSLKNAEVNISKGAELHEFAINLDRKFEGICRYTIQSSGRIVMVLQFYSEIIHFLMYCRTSTMPVRKKTSLSLSLSLNKI